MRAWVFSIVLLASVSTARAQAQGGALDPESYAALSADDVAQSSLGGFRGYLERIRESDALLYRQLDPRLDDLETRELVADVVFWTATGVSVALLVTAIPIYTELDDIDATAGLIIAGVSTFVVGVIVQAILRPGHQDLVALIDLHDELVGRR